MDVLRRKALTAAALLACTLSPALPAPAVPAAATGEVLSEEDLRRENAIKAAYLYHFADLSRWPESAFADAGSPVKICVLGPTSMAGAVAALDGKTAGGRPVESRHFATVHDLEYCHVLYLGELEPELRRQVLASVAEAAVLTAGEEESFLRDGGIARFFRRKNQIALEIHLGAARRAGLSFDDTLLEVGRVVGKD